MLKINQNFAKMPEGYLFAEVARRASEFIAKNPDRSVIRLGIGDVTRPLAKCITDAMAAAADEMSTAEGFKGYGPYEGYDFLTEKIREYYTERNIDVQKGEVFVSDGAKSDVSNILDLFSEDNIVMVPDPVYPVYVDTNLMGGRNVIYADANESNGFLPLPDGRKADIIYICSPNNPTGAVYTKDALKAWVDFANANGAVILFDAAYECFVADDDLPRSIYEIEGARKCAIEICSFSKTAGFTGTRLGYSIIPNDIVVDGVALNKLWYRRQSTKFNGVSYVVQKGGEMVFSEEGKKQIKVNIDYYRENAAIMTAALDELGIFYTGGKNSPYVWFKCPNNMGSWEFFDFLLENAGVVGTPGEGFGKNGEGFFRLTAFGTKENTIEAMNRLKNCLKK